MESRKKNIATIRVKTDIENPIDVDLMAEHIKAVADHFSNALEKGLTRQAIAILIHHSMPLRDRVSVKDIMNVLAWACQLRKYVTKK